MYARLSPVYTMELRLSYHPLTLAAYSLPWQYDGRRAYIHLCGFSVAVAETLDDTTRVTVYAAGGERCWESVLDDWRPVVNSKGLEPYYKRASRDRLLRCIGERLWGLTLKLANPWYAAIIAVCQQNASFRQGWGMVYKLHLLLGERMMVGDRLFIAPPRPERISADSARKAGLGYRARVIEELARVVKRGEDLREKAPAVKGVGSYTEGLIRLLGYGELDAHIVDRWIEALAAQAYGTSTREARRKWIETWRPWSGLASYHLTIVFDAEPLRKSVERLLKGDLCPHLDAEKPTPLTMWRNMPYPDR